jgi:hypothetical protein
MDAYERLREAYSRDVIDLEEFESGVDALLRGQIYALPAVWTIRPSGPPSTRNITAALKEAWGG